MLKLNPRQFASVFESLQAAGKSDGSEKRQSTRMDVQARVKLASIIDDKVIRSFTGLTRDLSSAGVGFFQHFPLESGAKFLIVLPQTKDALHITCVSRFCRAMAEGVFGIGAEFDSVAAPALVEQLSKFDNAATDRIKNSILA